MQSELRALNGPVMLCIIGVYLPAHTMALQDFLSVLTAGSPEEALARQVDFDRLPAPRRHHHGRQRPLGGAAASAARRGASRGHRCGARHRRDCRRLGIQVLTLYAFSVENWKRPRDGGRRPDGAAASATCALELNTLMSNNIRFRVIGRRGRARAGHPDELDGRPRHDAPATPACSSTSRSTTAGAPRSSTLRDARLLAAQIRPEELDEATVRELLYTAGQPDPDLLIRTSGEMRVSNFLLWQIAYAEIWVTDTLVAGFPEARSARGRARLPEARPPLRRDQQARGGRPLMTRVLSALVLAALVLGVVWFLPPDATLPARRIGVGAWRSPSTLDLAAALGATDSDHPERCRRCRRVRGRRRRRAAARARVSRGTHRRRCSRGRPWTAGPRRPSRRLGVALPGALHRHPTRRARRHPRRSAGATRRCC